MSHLSFKTAMTYFDNHFRQKKYRWLLICIEPKYLDSDGWLNTRREWHPLEYFDTKLEALNWLEEEVPKSEKEHWKLYEGRKEKL